MNSRQRRKVSRAIQRNKMFYDADRYLWVHWILVAGMSRCTGRYVKYLEKESR